MKMQRLDSSDKKVFKYIHTWDDGAVTEAVLYRYPDFETRTVLCISVMSGCPVGCVFCGTGTKFVRCLTQNEIIKQVTSVFEDHGLLDMGNGSTINSRAAKLQIMFMSMGEPMMCWTTVQSAIYYLHALYQNAELLISTVGIYSQLAWDGLYKTSKEISKVGLQLSIHRLSNIERGELIPHPAVMSLTTLRDHGLEWSHLTDRQVYLNFCIHQAGWTEEDWAECRKLFPPPHFALTFSVICQPDQTMADAQLSNIEIIKAMVAQGNDLGYNTRMFDPAGQDDIGGGCGQLWHFQEAVK